MFNKIFIVFILGICILGLQGTGVAQEDELPSYRGYVNDFAGILTPQITDQVTAVAQQVEAKTTAQIALVTIPTVAPLAIEQYAVELFEKWGIGQAGKDNGILILMAANDKKVWISTGYGLEGALPDAICKQIVYQIMIPEFRKGALDRGLLFGTIAVAELIAKEYNVALNLGEGLPRATQVKVSKKASLAKSIAYLIFFILIFGLRSGLLFFLILGPRGRRRGGYWYGTGAGGSGGGFGGGFGGFGGGFTGGGGAGGGW